MDTMRRLSRLRPLVMGAGASLAIGLAACGNGPPAGGGGGGGGGGGACTGGAAGVSLGKALVKVNATDAQQFAPASQTVKTGGIVEWDNPGSIQHNITFAQSCLTDGTFDPGAKWQ